MPSVTSRAMPFAVHCYTSLPALVQARPSPPSCTCTAKRHSMLGSSVCELQPDAGREGASGADFHQGDCFSCSPTVFPACTCTASADVSDAYSIMLSAHLCSEHPVEGSG
eukprot:662670-Pelagomonas_calceolata.AAC.1